MPTRTRRIPGEEGGPAKPRRNRGASRRTRTPAPDYLRGSLVDMAEEEILLRGIQGGPLPNVLRNEDKYLHVSDLLNRCMRMFALAERTGNKLTGDPLYMNLEVTFAIGNAIGQFLVDKSAQAMPDRLLGNWSCPCGTTKYFGLRRDAKDKICPKCEKPTNQYGEVKYVNEEYNISGSADLTYLLRKHLYLAEVKSIKKEDWEALVRPLPLHLLQILFYWWLARAKGYSLHKQVSVLYVCKAHTRGSPIKEFTINPENDIQRLDPYLEDAKMLKQAREGGALPFRVCASENVTMAKKCQLCTVCFGVN